MRSAGRYLLLIAVLLATRALAFAQPTPSQVNLPDASSTSGAEAPQLSPAASASLAGTVTDRDGALIAGARVSLSGDSLPTARTTVSGSDGRFLLRSLPAGLYRLSVDSDAQMPASRNLVLKAGQMLDLGDITLQPAGAQADVQVYASREELAEAELKAEETQRIAGFIPNFYVVYDWQAAPLSTRQKYHLALKTIIDPVTLLLNGASAGFEQAQNTFPGYGQGAAGYGKRFGANYGDVISGTLLGGALLPELFHQDPRYFYKGTGTVKHRLLYALATTVVCRGDNGKWQPCYSGILGDLGSGAISNAYYPSADRHGAALTFEQGLLSVGLDGLGNVIQEFVLRHLTPHPPTYPQAPQP